MSSKKLPNFKRYAKTASGERLLHSHLVPREGAASGAVQASVVDGGEELGGTGAGGGGESALQADLQHEDGAREAKSDHTQLTLWFAPLGPRDEKEMAPSLHGSQHATRARAQHLRDMIVLKCKEIQVRSIVSWDAVRERVCSIHFFPSPLPFRCLSLSAHPSNHCSSFLLLPQIHRSVLSTFSNKVAKYKRMTQAALRAGGVNDSPNHHKLKVYERALAWVQCKQKKRERAILALFQNHLMQSVDDVPELLDNRVRAVDVCVDVCTCFLGSCLVA